MRFGDDRVLTFLVIVVVIIKNNPIVRRAQFMRTRRIRKQSREMPTISCGVKNGKPCSAFGIESFRCNLRQFACCGTSSIFVIDVEQYIH